MCSRQAPGQPHLARQHHRAGRRPPPGRDLPGLFPRSGGLRPHRLGRQYRAQAAAAGAGELRLLAIWPWLVFRDRLDTLLTTYIAPPLVRGAGRCGGPRHPVRDPPGILLLADALAQPRADPALGQAGQAGPDHLRLQPRFHREGLRHRARADRGGALRLDTAPGFRRAESARGRAPLPADGRPPGAAQESRPRARRLRAAARGGGPADRRGQGRRRAARDPRPADPDPGRGAHRRHRR